MNRDHAYVEWDSTQEKWLAVKVSETPLRAWDDYDLAVKYAEACGLHVLRHQCHPGCEHPSLTKLSVPTWAMGRNIDSEKGTD